MLVITNLDYGGAQRVFHDQSLLFSKRFSVTEVVFNLDGGNAFPTGNPLVSLEVAGGGNVFAKFRNLMARARRLQALKAEHRTALSISHMEGANFVNVLSKGSEKTVLCVHGTKLHDANFRGLTGYIRKQLLLRLLYNRADRIVVVSRDIKPELTKLGVDAGKIVTINNFFDPRAIRRQANKPLTGKEHSIFAGTPVIVTSGRLARQKNQRALIDVFAKVLSKRPAKLLLLGDGELREELLAHARGLGLRVFDVWSGTPLHGDHDVYFLGYQANPFKFQKAATLFALPSAWEGFPMVLGEAMACGLPIVAADCATGPREMLAPSTGERPDPPIAAAECAEFGILMPLLDPKRPAVACWASLLSQLLSDNEERARLAKAATRRVKDFTEDHAERAWLALADELLGSSAR